MTIRDNGRWAALMRKEDVKEGMLCMHTVNERPRYGVVYQIRSGLIWCQWCDTKQEALDVIPCKNRNIDIERNLHHLYYWKRSGLGAFLDAHT